MRRVPPEDVTACGRSLGRGAFAQSRRLRGRKRGPRSKTCASDGRASHRFHQACQRQCRSTPGRLGPAQSDVRLSGPRWTAFVGFVVERLAGSHRRAQRSTAEIHFLRQGLLPPLGRRSAARAMDKCRAGAAQVLLGRRSGDACRRSAARAPHGRSGICAQGMRNFPTGRRRRSAGEGGKTCRTRGASIAHDRGSERMGFYSAETGRGGQREGVEC